MKTMQAQLTVKMPIFPKFHQQAEKFSKNQSNPQKYKEVYLNTLAVLVVDFYLKCLEIETDLEKSESWNPVIHSLMNVADLVIRNLGKIECRIILPGEDICYIPEEVWEDRIGFIGVQINQELTEAKLVGFLAVVTTENVRINQFKSLEYLLDKLSNKVTLTQWLDNIFNTPEWELLENVLKPQTHQLAFRFRGGRATQVKTETQRSERVKIINLEKSGEKLALVVGIKPIESSTEFKVWAEIYAMNEQNQLPSGLNLMILNEEQEEVMKTLTKGNKSVQLDFTGELGECFSVKMVLGDVSITEEFKI